MTDIVFAVHDAELARALRDHLAGASRVTIVEASLLELETDALVAPGNSFGWMDGGLDLQLVERFGDGLEQRVQEAIATDWVGEAPVGTWVTVRLDTDRWLVYAPTMRVPMVLPPDTVAPYLAMRAVLHAARQLPERVSIGVPGLGTGVGRVPAATFARQVAEAIGRFSGPPPEDWWEGVRAHQLLAGPTVRDLQQPVDGRPRPARPPDGGVVVEDTVDPDGDTVYT